MHHSDDDVQEMQAHPLQLIGLVACFPILSFLGLFLVIPLGPYVADHAPFTNLNVARPDHYVRLLSTVYKAWAASEDGKLKIGKDL